MRLGVYTDYTYHQGDGDTYAERAFAVFVARLAPHFDRLVVIGRLDPTPSKARYPLGGEVDFVPLPYYRSLASPAAALRSMGSAAKRFWGALETLDCVWLLGPNPFAIVFAALASLRGKRVVLGVRQDYREYVRARHPNRRWIHFLAAILGATFRGLARVHPVVVVGPELTIEYRRSTSVLEIAVSLVDADDIVAPADVAGRSYDGSLEILSVGRLEEEKNPLLLAQVLAHLNRQDEPRWRLTVCGEGPMQDALAAELARLGQDSNSDLRGYVHQEGGLRDLYRDSHAFLHVSWTEGLPQVLLEAFAAGLPTVATDVGGVRAAVGHAATLVPPGSAEAAARALLEIAADPDVRSDLIEAGHEYVSTHTLTHESMRVSAFLLEDEAGGAADRSEK